HLAELDGIDPQVFLQGSLGIQDFQGVAGDLREHALHAARHLVTIHGCLHRLASTAVNRLRTKSGVEVVSMRARVDLPAAQTTVSKVEKRSPRAARRSAARIPGRSAGSSISRWASSQTLRTAVAPDLSDASLTVHRKV